MSDRQSTPLFSDSSESSPPTARYHTAACSNDHHLTYIKHIDQRLNYLVNELSQSSHQSSHFKGELLTLIMNTLHLHSNHTIRNRSQQSINQSISRSLNQSLNQSFSRSIESEADLIAELEEFYGLDGESSDLSTDQSMSDSDSVDLNEPALNHTVKRKLESVDPSTVSPYTHQIMQSTTQSLSESSERSATRTTDQSDNESDNHSTEHSTDSNDQSDDDVVDTVAVSFLSPSISCGICGLFMYRPVTPIECGHSFCRACLTSYIHQQSSNQSNNQQQSPCCPVESCGVTFAADSARSVCVQLSGTLERCFPREHAIAKLHSDAINAISVGADDQAVRLLSQSINEWPDCFSLYATRLCANLRLCQFDASLEDLRACMTMAQAESPSPASHPYSRSDFTIGTLTQLGQAGLFTRIYQLSIYAFASALSLSHQNDPRLDREMIANKLVEAYVAEARKQSAPKPLLQSSSRSLRPSSSTSLIGGSSTSLMRPTAPTTSTSTSLMSSSTSTSTSLMSASSRSLIPAAQRASPPPTAPVNQATDDSASQSSSQSTSQSTSTNNPDAPSTSSAPPTVSSPVLPPLSTFILDVAARDYQTVVRSSPSRHASKAARSADPLSSVYRALRDHPLPSAINGELQCLLCMDLLYQPVTVRCGHTFCNTCLARSLDHKNLCPFCRESLSVHISPQRQPVNQSIKAILERWCSRAYAERAAAITAELEEQSLYIPLFVCTLMFPGVSCPLHIFEPRYRLMIRSVLESGYNRFGMVVQIDKDGSYSSVGCTAEIRSVRLLPDGRSLVDTVGGRRFVIKEKGCRNGYDVAKIEYLEDLTREEQEEMFSCASPSLSELQDQVRTLVDETLLPRMLNSFDIESQLGPMPSPEDHVLYAYWLCAVLPMRLDDKFEFLQFRSDYERFAKLQATLTELQDKEWC